MLFTHDTEAALMAVAALINTASDGLEQLPDTASLDAFLTEWRWTGSRRGDQAELASVQALRPRMRELWTLDDDAAADFVNTLLREFTAVPQLVKHDGWDYHLHATDDGAPLADRMVVEAAMAMSDVIRTKQRDRLRFCAATGCENVLIDLSKNSSRRFCSVSCANRTNVAAYRARRSQ